MSSVNYWLYKLRLKDPGKLTSGFSEADLQTMSRHRDYLQALTQTGTVTLAGRTDAGEATFGIVVFRAEGTGKAREIMEGDPAVSEGLMQAELFPYLLAFLARYEEAIL